MPPVKPITATCPAIVVPILIILMHQRKRSEKARPKAVLNKYSSEHRVEAADWRKMSVMLETSVGDVIIDLYTDKCPNTTRNFLKLCKCKYYNGVLFHNVQKDYIVQTGDPTGTGRGGESMFGCAAS
jgi:hypothetical protein